MSSEPVIVVGIDVGGPAKGFHGVALQDRRLVSKCQAYGASDMSAWCVEMHASAVGVDAPCRCSAGPARLAERALAAEGIFSFATPARESAEAKPFYRWMLAGWELYQLLEQNFPLFRGSRAERPMCIETFPHAITCALAGRVVPARQKNTLRRELLRRSEIDPAQFTNIDEIDAALCALAAEHFYRGSFKAYGDANDGFIVVPQTR